MQTDAELITYFFYNLDVFLIIAVRILGFMIILPVLSGANIPMVIRVTFSVIMAYIIFVSRLTVDLEYHNNIMGYGILVAQEFFVGFVIALVVYVVFSTTYLVGQMMDLQIGFSMVNVLDPVMQIQVPVVGNLLYMIMTLFLIQAGGLHAFISALFFSYDALPIGRALIVGNGNIAYELLELIGIYFVLGVQISMPVVGSILMVDIALGLLVKAVPQMNIFVVGVPLKIIFGLIVLYFIAPVFYDVYELLFSEAMRAVIAIIRGLTP